MLIGKVILSFNRCIDMKEIVYISKYYPKPKPLGGNLKV